MRIHKSIFCILLFLFCPIYHANGATSMQLVTLDSSNHAVLRERAKEVQFPLDAKTKSFLEDFQKFFADLKSPFGKPAGLAAPQIGTSLRVFMVQIPEEAKQIRKDVHDVVPPTVFINLTYTPIESEGKYKDWEGCFSVNDKMGEVYRYNAIQYEAYTVDGKKISGTARGLFARVLQHETDHLNGQLFIDYKNADCRVGSFDEMMKIRKAEMVTQ